MCSYIVISCGVCTGCILMYFDECDVQVKNCSSTKVGIGNTTKGNKKSLTVTLSQLLWQLTGSFMANKSTVQKEQSL